jgi:hypothetical protein
VKDAIIATEAFMGGNGMDLYQLNQLDNSDKHIEVTPVLRATSYPGFQIYTPSGTLHERVEPNTLVPAASGITIATLMKVEPGFTFEVDYDAECSPSIFIIHPGGAITSPAIPTLRRYLASVASVIVAFERAIP